MGPDAAFRLPTPLARGTPPAMLLRIGLAALVLLCPVTAANATDWAYEDGSVPIAYAESGAAQFQFACRGGDLAMAYWVRNPGSEVAGAVSMNLAIVPDAAEGATVSAAGGARFAEDLPLIHNDGSSVVVRGPVARQWARLAQRAKSSMLLAYVRPKGGGGLDVFESHSFGASGSAAAIAQVLDRCG